MANYKQEALNGAKYNRFSRITIYNPLNQTAAVSVAEEQVLSLDGEIIKREVGEVSKSFDPTEMFQERDPQTGELTGKTLNAYEVYKAIYSYVITMAIQRDEKEAADILAASKHV